MIKLLFQNESYYWPSMPRNKNYYRPKKELDRYVLYDTVIVGKNLNTSRDHRAKNEFPASNLKPKAKLSETTYNKINKFCAHYLSTLFSKT